MGRLWADLKEKMNFRTCQSLKLRDYRSDQCTFSEWVFLLIEAFLVAAFFAYFFYRSVIALFPMGVIGGLFLREQLAKKRAKCREMLTVQFKECILSVTTSLRAGYAVENAFLESRRDVRMLYGERSMIYQELELIRRGMVINITLEELLMDLAERSGIEEIEQFAQIFAIAKRSGGNLPEIMKTSVDLINRKIETKQEIRTVLSGRKMEQNIMKLVPFGILFYIGVSYPGYFDDLYHNLKGILIMTGCLLIYLAAYLMGERIMKEIEKKMM